MGKRQDSRRKVAGAGRNAKVRGRYRGVMDVRALARSLRALAVAQ